MMCASQVCLQSVVLGGDESFHATDNSTWPSHHCQGSKIHTLSACLLRVREPTNLVLTRHGALYSFSMKGGQLWREFAGYTNNEAMPNGSYIAHSSLPDQHIPQHWEMVSTPGFEPGSFTSIRDTPGQASALTTEPRRHIAPTYGCTQLLLYLKMLVMSD